MTPKQRRALNKKAKETAQHFKKDGWALDFLCELTDLRNEMLGFDPMFFYLEALNKKLKPKLVALEVKDGRMLLKVKKGQKNA